MRTLFSKYTKKKRAGRSEMENHPSNRRRWIKGSELTYFDIKKFVSERN